MQTIRQSDQQRAEIFRKYFNVGWRDPELYHLMINTEEIPPERAASLIVEAAKRVLAPA
jgi:cytidylate kinase